MGLDTSHDCWHGPYSMFMRWRQWLHYFIMIERPEVVDERGEPLHYKGATRESLIWAWDHGVYANQDDALNVLMLHSDCDGEIPHDVCHRLADALAGLMYRRMPERGLYDEMRPATERFIAGLRRAFEAGQPVEFH